MRHPLLIGLLSSSLLVSADTLVLRSGTRVDGSYLGGNNRSIQFAAGDSVRSFDLVDVLSLQFSASAVPVQMQPHALRIPAYTHVSISLIDPVDSSRDQLGQHYRASLADPLYVQGQEMLPRGADAELALVDDTKAGRLAGRTAMTLQLVAITANGRRYDVVTQPVVRATASRGNRSAGVIGGATGLGAVIGGLAGGGRGAAIGAISGAGAGTAGSVFTPGGKVKLPAETRLEFVLEQPLEVRE